MRDYSSLGSNEPVTDPISRRRLFGSTTLPQFTRKNASILAHRQPRGRIANGGSSCSSSKSKRFVYLICNYLLSVILLLRLDDTLWILSFKCPI